jgi:hypothetical protein
VPVLAPELGGVRTIEFEFAVDCGLDVDCANSAVEGPTIIAETKTIRSIYGAPVFRQLNVHGVRVFPDKAELGANRRREPVVASADEENRPGGDADQ